MTATTVETKTRWSGMLMAAIYQGREMNRSMALHDDPTTGGALLVFEWPDQLLGCIELTGDPANRLTDCRFAIVKR